jgi:hypothetical protein
MAGKNSVYWRSILCGGVMKPVKNRIEFHGSALSKGNSKQNMTKPTGARAPLGSKKPYHDAYRCHHDGVISGLCVIQIPCFRVSWCYGAVLLSTLLFFSVIYDRKKRRL